jgi:hypothetical protein
MTYCPNCSAEIKSNLLTTNKLLDETSCNLLNYYLGKDVLQYCQSCGDSRTLKAAKEKAKDERDILFVEYEDRLQSVPVLTISNPPHWDFEVLEIVTAYIDAERKAADDRCFNALRIATITRGGNAIIDVTMNIHQTLFGGQLNEVSKPYLHAYGTAVLLKNIDILGDKKQDIEQLQVIQERLYYFKNYLGII